MGAGYCIFDGDGLIYTRQLRLHDECSVFQAELLAVSEALRFLKDSSLLSTGEVATLYTDSQSSIAAIQDVGTCHPLVNKIHKRIIKLQNPKLLHLVWVRGHSGVVGNMLADELARKATSMRNKPHYADIPISSVKYIFQQTLNAEQEIHYNSLTSATQIKTLFPSYQTLQSSLSIYTPDWIDAQFITGHGKFRSYLERVNLLTSPSCPCSMREEQTPAHLLLRCPHFRSERRLVQEACRANGYYGELTMACLFEPGVFKFTKWAMMDIHRALRDQQ